MSSEITTEEIKELTDEWLGPTLVALASGTRYRDEVTAWWCTGYMPPNADESRRLAFTLEVLREVEASEGSRNIARAWFIGANVGDDLISPAEAIRVDRFDEVRVSVQHLIEDIPFSA